MAQAVRACALLPVVDGDIEHTAKVCESRRGDLGTFENSFGPFAARGKLSELNEDVVVDLERESLGQMSAFRATSACCGPAQNRRI